MMKGTGESPFFFYLSRIFTKYVILLVLKYIDIHFKSIYFATMPGKS